MIDKFKKFKLTACCWYAAAVSAFSLFCYIVQFGNKGKTNQISASMILYGGYLEMAQKVIEGGMFHVKSYV